MKNNKKRKEKTLLLFLLCKIFFSYSHKRSNEFSAETVRSFHNVYFYRRHLFAIYVCDHSRHEQPFITKYNLTFS
jgi:hypothetical protein